MYRENETRQSSNKAKGECERREKIYFYSCCKAFYTKSGYMLNTFWNSEAKQNNETERTKRRVRAGLSYNNSTASAEKRRR